EADRVPPAPAAPATPVPWAGRVLALTASRNMWLFGGLQFFINLGWAFLITYLPEYLKERYKADVTEVGQMQTAALAIGCLGMACGGLLADAMYLRLGPRWGRSAPVAVMMAGCASTYVAATQLPSAWAV